VQLACLEGIPHANHSPLSRTSSEIPSQRPPSDWPPDVPELNFGGNVLQEALKPAMPTRYVVTFTPMGRPGYRVGEFPNEDRARDAAERHGAPPRGATPRPPLQWSPAPQFGAITAITTAGVFVIAPG